MSLFSNALTGSGPKCSSCSTALPANSRFCTQCGTPVAQASALNNAEMKIETGKIESNTGALSFSFSLLSDGTERITIYAYEPNNMRKSGTILFLQPSQLNDLKNIVFATENAMMELRQRRGI
jgi:hypothetical protein